MRGLDNGARLDWEKPMTVMGGGTVIGYRIHRDAWNAMENHPINMYGDAVNDQIGSATDRSDLGLAYETVYSYRVLAIVDLDAATWWNKLDCAMMNMWSIPTSASRRLGPTTRTTTRDRPTASCTPACPRRQR